MCREYKPLDCKVSSVERCLNVPVPLCHFKLPTEQKLLHGWRIAVKDCFDMRGIRTSLGSKAYYELFPPALQTAEALRALCDAGGTIVGKTRLCSLVSKEDPTEAIDYAAPFNPRADGYQAPSGSSTGSSVAISSYPWIDLTIGTDSEFCMPFEEVLF
jgi:Asp-tRNA(Asn)/Glu-tRNA(Gln) amidotransferase A subunit family amidase